MDDLKTEDVDTGVASFSCTISYATESRAQIEEMMCAGNYILRSNDGEDEFYTIIDYESDTKDQTVTVYSEDAGLDLLNEIVGAFEADASHNAEWYINNCIVDTGFEIGINEIPADSVRKLSWDGESTATARLASIATQFGGYEVSYSFKIEGLEVRKKYINFYEKRGKDASEQLRLNREIDNIRVIKSIENLATALRCTGGTPEDAEEPITLKGYTYDDGDFWVGTDGVLRSREALKKWSRYIWNKEPGLVGGAYEGHIARWYSYDTLDQGALCSHAITELKKLCDMQVNYEVEITRLPDDVKIGDRIDVVDEEGKLFLSTRILVLETSITNQTQKATLGEFILKSDGISDKVKEMAANLALISRISSSAKNEAIAAKKEVDDAAKTATNYIESTGEGLVIGNVTASDIGNNVLIDTETIDIRNGTTVYASYGADLIELGKNSTSSVIKLCADGAELRYEDLGGSNGLDIISDGVRLYSSSDSYFTVLPTAITGVSDRVGLEAVNGLHLYTEKDVLDVSTLDGDIQIYSTNGDVYIDGQTLCLDYSTIKFNGTSLTATAKELNYCYGVTSNIQTQLNNKQATITRTNLDGKSKAAANATVTTITSASLSAGTYLVLGHAIIPTPNSPSGLGRKICISTSTSFDNAYASGCAGEAAFATSLNCWALLTLSATTTVYLLGYQGSGSSQTITEGRLSAIKLS
ncbi:MAG: phage tail protein [Bacteroidaceae bacterium]|nr:phage tail protein [Bacteroidaceae bacterium]